jgi:hypothetical protein
VQLKRPDFSIFFKEKIKELNTFSRFARQKIINRIAPAGVRLVFVVKLVKAFGASPHGGIFEQFSTVRFAFDKSNLQRIFNFI